VADELRTHFTEGRLDVDEFSSRLDEAWSAETVGALARVLRQLPRLPGRPRPGDPPPLGSGAWPSPGQPWSAPPWPVSRRGGWEEWPVVAKLAIVVLAVIVLTSLWPLWLVLLVGWLVFIRPRRYRYHHRWYGA
jgi:hypothetical protein